MSEVGCDIVEYLKEFHTSEGKAVKARELCVLFNVHEKQLRNIVSDLRQNGDQRYTRMDLDIMKSHRSIRMLEDVFQK